MLLCINPYTSATGAKATCQGCAAVVLVFHFYIVMVTCPASLLSLQRKIHPSPLPCPTASLSRWRATQSSQLRLRLCKRPRPRLPLLPRRLHWSSCGRSWSRGSPPEKKMALVSDEQQRLMQRAIQQNLLAMTAQLPMSIRINSQGTRLPENRQDSTLNPATNGTNSISMSVEINGIVYTGRGKYGCGARERMCLPGMFTPSKEQGVHWWQDGRRATKLLRV
ncbi:hypothetical protein lerEdw1_008499 [Lerista edwardsae]|nr:hypothetical protein lerEdw1_008499 [Lerista edwardsae]